MILLLFEYPTLCGGEQSLLCLIPALEARGCRFAAAAPPDGPLAAALAEHGVEVIPLRLHEDSGERRSLATCRAELHAVLQQYRPELVHANSLSMARLLGPVAADCGVPSVGHIRDIVGLSSQAISDVNRNALLLTVSEAAAAFHAAQGIDRARLHVLYNGVDLEKFTPRPPTGYLHRELALPRDAKLLASIGQIGVRKGLDVLLTALKQVIPKWPQAHLLLVGERFSRKDEAVQYEAKLRAKAATEPLAGHVHFLGWRTDVAQLLPELKLLVHPARQEPLGRVLLEAAASGCAVVATRVGGTAEIFSRPDPATILVPPDDALALADAILSIAGAPARHQPDRSQVLFTVTDTAERLLTHWRGLIGTISRSGGPSERKASPHDVHFS